MWTLLLGWKGLQFSAPILMLLPKDYIWLFYNSNSFQFHLPNQLLCWFYSLQQGKMFFVIGILMALVQGQQVTYTRLISARKTSTCGYQIHLYFRLHHIHTHTHTLFTLLIYMYIMNLTPLLINLMYISFTLDTQLLLRSRVWRVLT